MLFSQKRNTTAKGPMGCDNTHGSNGWVNLSVISVSIPRAFYSIQMNLHSKY